MKRASTLTRRRTVCSALSARTSGLKCSAIIASSGMPTGSPALREPPPATRMMPLSQLLMLIAASAPSSAKKVFTARASSWRSLYSLTRFARSAAAAFGSVNCCSPSSDVASWRCESGSVPRLYSRASPSSRILPASLPRQPSMSASFLISTRTSSPSTGPSVPGVQALGRACSCCTRSPSISTLAELNSQPRPKSSKASSRALASPHSSNFPRVQALASAIPGELVRRAPMLSVRWLKVAITWELWKASWRMRLTMSRSTGSAAVARPPAPRQNTSRQRFNIGFSYGAGTTHATADFSGRGHWDHRPLVTLHACAGRVRGGVRWWSWKGQAAGFGRRRQAGVQRRQRCVGREVGIEPGAKPGVTGFVGQQHREHPGTHPAAARVARSILLPQRGREAQRVGGFAHGAVKLRAPLEPVARISLRRGGAGGQRLPCPRGLVQPQVYRCRDTARIHRERAVALALGDHDFARPGIVIKRAAVSPGRGARIGTPVPAGRDAGLAMPDRLGVGHGPVEPLECLADAAAPRQQVGEIAQRRRLVAVRAGMDPLRDLDRAVRELLGARAVVGEVAEDVHGLAERMCVVVAFLAIGGRGQADPLLGDPEQLLVVGTLDRPRDGQRGERMDPGGIRLGIIVRNGRPHLAEQDRKS